jgi:integrase/recombinase XerD
VLLTSRKPGHAVASGDLCPVTRRARLYYRRAAESFERATRPLANPGASHEELEEVHGWTLHQLRHSLLTYEAEDGTSTPDAARPVQARLRPVPRALRPPRTPRPSHATSPPPTQPPSVGVHDRLRDATG